MKKAIFRQMTLLASLGIILASAVLCGIFYNQLTGQMRIDMRGRTQIFINDDYKSAIDNLSLVDPEEEMRITIVSPGGTVLFDNMVEPRDWENHLGREEIEEALSSGEGESCRFSSTLDTKTYYYAVRLADGSVLRTAKTINSMWRVFAGILPVTGAVILLCIAVAYLASGRLAKRVVEPIGQVDLSGEPDVPYDELAPFAKEIADQRKQIRQGSQQLRESIGTINAIMDNMAEGVVLFDRRGTILSLNKSAARIFDAERPMEGSSPLELLRDLDFNKQLKRALEGRRGEMAFHKADREYRVIISPAEETGVVVFFLDITERSEAERLRREFSANVSHELKTPLTSIYGNAEMLKSGVVKDDDKLLFYGKILDEASRLIDLVEDIMMLSELDEGKTQQAHDRVNLFDVAYECMDALAQKAEKHHVTVKVKGSGVITANRALIYEMFYNLIDNGIKYNKLGGDVEVAISQKEEKTTIIVSDTGIGISAADRDRIFERFYRTDKSRSKKSGGTGLGLAIVKHIVMVHGGSIQVTSNQGEGVRFEISF